MLVLAMASHTPSGGLAQMFRTLAIASSTLPAFDVLQGAALLDQLERKGPSLSFISISA